MRDPLIPAFSPLGRGEGDGTRASIVDYGFEFRLRNNNFSPAQSADAIIRD